MAAEIVQIDTQNFTSQTYGGQDTNLISTFEVNTSLSSSSYIEYFVYDNNQNILSTDYNFTQYIVLADGQSAGSNNTISQIIIDPEKSLINSGFDQGEYVTYFNFFNKQIGSELQQLYIVEISSDRTEIRLDSTSLTNLDIVEQANSLIQQREDSPYFLDFYLNFGDNQLAIANNIQLDSQDPTNPTILIKLYEALPEEFDVNSTLWVVTLVEEPIAYQIIFPLEPIEILDTVNLKGPNFNLELKDQINNSTVSLDYTALTTTSLTSSYNQLSSLLEEKEIDINIDYTDFNEFVHFSSVEARLENFYYKMSLLEDYSSSIAVLNTTTNNDPSASLAVYESLINNVITNFDGYEYYLYYNSGSWAWPKTTSQPPYQLATTGSALVTNWYTNISLSASNFDNTNQNNLYYSIPEYLRNDSLNAPYQMFVEMMGQFYDNIWIYYKDVTQKYNADNRLEYGVSKDIVADAIRDFGIKLYQNNFSNDDLYTAFLGLTPEGGLFPFPNITGSLPTPSGFEYINTLISASNDYMPLDDVNKSLYKRIYHNLPYLLKAKGTLPALRTLITSYGIPDTVLRINEFGGKDKSNSNDWDDWQNVFNYAYYNTGSNLLSTNWILNSNWNSPNNVPSTLEFRFKVPSLSTISGSSGINLWNTNTNARIRLRYTGSGLTTGSYSGSIIDPYYQYATLDFSPDFSGNPSLSASVYLPFVNEGWWSVMATRRGTNFTLYVGNNVYEGGENGTQLGFYATSSTTVSSTAWTSGNASRFTQFGGEMYFQEIRYYNTALSESIFKDYIMNPSSTEGNSINSSPNQLAFRLPLGGELYTGSLSVHPKITGSWATTSSFTTNSSASFTFTPTFVPNTEYFFLDQPVVGIKNAVSDKIRIENSVIPSGDTLSPFRSLAQNTAASQSYTVNTNLLEVAFAPQDEINDDIISQIGFFNIGEYIGDPRQRSSSATSYPDLDALRDAYFQKYTSNYDLNDYIRLIKYFDNSLFKMIKDFVPARTSLASGVVIKQTLLERNKYPQPQVSQETVTYTGSIESTQLWDPITQQKYISHSLIETFDGGAGGVFNTFNTLTNTSQSWYETIPTPSGSVTVLHNSQDEFYDGEFSGSALVVTTQSLAQSLPLDISSLTYNVTNSISTTPTIGEITWVGTTYISSSYVYRLYINENSLEGVNISTALSNLESGNTITFNVSASVIEGPFSPYAFESTVKGIITSIVSTAPSIWRINLSTDPNSLATYYTLQYPDSFTYTPGLYPSSSTYLNPFINDVSNFYNSDYNPLINNTEGDRLSTKFQDIDYSTGIYTPTNFNLLISGSALKAAVQDSNYTSKRVTLPRYEGSKSTSQNLNYWTPGDAGTYGKLPTVESLKTMVAYCDDIGGWPPERENASAAFVKYLIKSDGTIIIPNTTPNSLADNQETFESGENVLVQYAGTGNQATPIRKIIRGGTRIEPILYTQYGQAPGSTWNTTMSFENIVPASVVATGNYAASFNRTSLQQISSFNTPTKILFNSATYGSSYFASNGYQVPLGAVQDGVDLIFNPIIQFQCEKDLNSSSQILSNNFIFNVTLKLYKGTQLISTSNTLNPTILSDEELVEGTIAFTSPITIPAANLNNGNQYFIYIEWNSNYPSNSLFYVFPSTFTINQYPIFFTPVTSSGVNSIWGWPNKTTYPYVITSSQTTLVNLYGDPGVKMSDITGSGFNSVILPWSIKYGDEFKFEGNESYVYQVGKIFAPADSGSGRITQTGSIEVHFNTNLPVSASSSVFNLDHFAIRRYVDEASQILIEGFKPVGSSGPYILKPEYVTPELNKGVDEFILILTEKGLI